MISAKKSFLMLNLLLLAGVVYYGVEIFYKTIESSMEYVPVPGQADAPPETVNKKPTASHAHYKPIVNRDLFGTLKIENQTEPALDIEALKPTELNLKLWGTVANEGGRSAFAVIEELKTRKQSLYRAGDSIQNATVKAILREKVILSVGGKDEILTMAAAYSEKMPARRGQSRAAIQNNITLQRSFINDAIKNIGTLLGQVRIRPHFEGGEPAGLSMTGIKPNSIFSKMGLKSGDVLRGVDSQEIRSVNDVIGLYEKLKSSSKVTLEVKRRNKLRTITYRIN